MTTLKGTKTEQNLLKAFAGESQARNRYTYFGKIAKKEGYEQISAIFLETAEQERTHAKIFFSFLEGGTVEITASYPAGKISTTLENLKASAAGENEEWTSLYQGFSETAKQEGFAKVAGAFKMIAKIEEEHEKRFRKLIFNLENDKVFSKDEKVKWICRECGYVHEGEKALESCPVCAHPKAYFEMKSENY
jgi:rubrerythrin